MAYSYKTPPTGVEIVWVKAIKKITRDYGNHLFGEYGLEVGSVSWITKYHFERYSQYAYLEDNRYATNFDIECFKVIPAPTSTTPVVKGWRFKTEAEFTADGLWVKSWGYYAPKGWNDRMTAKYVGQLIPDEYWHRCEANSNFGMDGWSFDSRDYVAITKKAAGVSVSKISLLASPQKALK